MGGEAPRAQQQRLPSAAPRPRRRTRGRRRPAHHGVQESENYPTSSPCQSGWTPPALPTRVVGAKQQNRVARIRGSQTLVTLNLRLKNLLGPVRSKEELRRACAELALVVQQPKAASPARFLPSRYQAIWNTRRQSRPFSGPGLAIFR